MNSLFRGRRRGLRAALPLVAAGVLSIAGMAASATSAHASTAGASPSCTAAHTQGSTRIDHKSIAHAVSVNAACNELAGSSDPAIGSPPLIFHNGAVMGTASTGPVVLTPIFWSPSGHPMDAGYKNLIVQYLKDVAAASGSHTNVFSTLPEYYGTNGGIRYQVGAGATISDTSAFPASGCNVANDDTRNIYADNSGYDACLDDNQLIAEVDAVVTAQNLPRDNGHMYLLFLPKHVESCFYAGQTENAQNVCTINHHPSAGYCAYHSEAPSTAVYGNMPFPIYNSPVGYTCGSEYNFGTVQSPNNNPDADVEISPTSHEVMEAITDPDTSTGWYDAAGYENGDECAYVYGATQGKPNGLYNQLIKGHRYLTQEEFSNKDFAATGGGCLQSE